MPFFFDLSITNFTVYLFLTFIIILIIMSIATKNATVIPNNFQLI